VVDASDVVEEVMGLLEELEIVVGRVAEYFELVWSNKGVSLLVVLQVQMLYFLALPLGYFGKDRVELFGEIGFTGQAEYHEGQVGLVGQSQVVLRVQLYFESMPGSAGEFSVEVDMGCVGAVQKMSFLFH